MTKGADNIMFPRISWTDNMKETVAHHLMQFAKSGLRTLVMGQK